MMWSFKKEIDVPKNFPGNFIFLPLTTRPINYIIIALNVPGISREDVSNNDYDYRRQK